MDHPSPACPSWPSLLRSQGGQSQRRQRECVPLFLLRTVLSFPAVTDRSKWHLTTDKGRHVWVYNEQGVKQNITDKYFLGIDIVRTPSDIMIHRLPPFRFLTSSLF